MTQGNNSPPTRKLRMVNSKSANLAVWLEPLGDRVALPPGATFEFCVSDQIGDCPTIVVTDNSSALYGWVQEVRGVQADGPSALVWEFPPQQPSASSSS